MGEKRDRERAARLAETNGPNPDGAPDALRTGGRETEGAERGGAGALAAAKRTKAAATPRSKPASVAQDHGQASSDLETSTGENAAQGTSRKDVSLSQEELREIRIANLRPHQFAPGNPGPGKGIRKRLAGDFVRELHRDFNEHGPEAIAKCRTQRPAEYVRIIASLLPKQIDIRESDLADTDDDALESFLALARSALLGRGEAGAGEGTPAIEGSARVVSPLP